MMTSKFRIPASLMLTAFFGCSTGTVLLVDDVAPRQATAQYYGGQDVDDGYFYSNLAPHGQWFFQAEFGWVWHPARVNVGWRPYTEGQWVWGGDVGWTWASQEPWGWATYHYGRWYFDPMYGWSWVPGRVWAPAWVSWRVESGYIGWAPMWPVWFDRNPDYRWDRWRHDGDWDRRHSGRDWDRWVFTRDRDFTSERVGRRAITDRNERDRIFSSSRDVTQYDESRPERTGHSIDRAMVEKATGRPVRSVRIESADKPGERADTSGESIKMFRPRVKEAPDKTPDRLGLAKEPTKEARETGTLRKEKQRLDSVPEKDRGREKGATSPAVREKDDERGGGAAGADRPDAREPASSGKDKAADREPAARGKSDTERGGKEVREPKSAAPERKQQQPEARPEPKQREQKQVQPERKQPAQKQVQPERKQPEKAQKPRPQQQEKPAVQPRQEREIRQQAPPKAAPSGQQRESRPPQQAPQVEQQRGGQPDGKQGGQPQPGRGKPESGKPEPGKKQPQPEDLEQEPKGQGRN
ncbi:MAG: DUF6600 domain-containing protein [Candidatus Binatia bacterium]